MTPKTDAQYIEKSDHCPYCDSENIEGQEVNIEGQYAFQEIGCNDCEATWYDEYRLTGYVGIQSPSGVKK